MRKGSTARVMVVIILGSLVAALGASDERPKAAQDGPRPQDVPISVHFGDSDEQNDSVTGGDENEPASMTVKVYIPTPVRVTFTYLVEGGPADCWETALKNPPQQVFINTLDSGKAEFALETNDIAADCVLRVRAYIPGYGDTSNDTLTIED